MYLSVYLYYSFLIVSHISSFYNRLRIVRRGWASLRLKGGVLMSGYKIIMIILGILSVMISFGALVALICLEIAK